jgi:hypothetical protein
MKRRRAFILACLGCTLTAGLWAADMKTKPAVRTDVPASLAKQAKITLETARATALAKVPGGEVRSEELEKEHGKLIYSFDIEVAGTPGVTEVNVSAIDGKVLAVEHETAKKEASEEAGEAKAHPPSP